MRSLIITGLVLTMFLSTSTAFAFSKPGNENASPFDDLKKIMLERRSAKFELCRTARGNTVEAWYFPGTSNLTALVIGGVHGSELSSIEVARELIEQLKKGDSIYYNVIIIPCLFPDNALTAQKFHQQIGSPYNFGRYTNPGSPDPNRQMPSPGYPLYEDSCYDHTGRAIETENVFLLQLIQEVKPQRIASIHAIRNIAFSGVFADPRTDEHGVALGFETDSSLAITMAHMIERNGGRSAGNFIKRKANAVYYLDPKPAPAGEFQLRNVKGSTTPGHKGGGISLGTWASTAVRFTGDSSLHRDAIRILTIEFPGSKRPSDYKNVKQKQAMERQVYAYAYSIRTVFLRDYYTEQTR